MWLNVEAQKTIKKNQTRNKTAFFFLFLFFLLFLLLLFFEFFYFLHTMYNSIPYLIAQSVRKTLYGFFVFYMLSQC